MEKWKWIQTTLRKSVHMEHDSPVFGETVTRVEVVDEAAGPFLQLSQESTEGDREGIRLDWPNEFNRVVEAATELMSNFPSEEFDEEADHAGDSDSNALRCGECGSFATASFMTPYAIGIRCRNCGHEKRKTHSDVFADNSIYTHTGSDNNVF